MMDKFSFWSDSTVHRVMPTSTCASFESDEIVASMGGSCSSCYYCVGGTECHNVAVSNMKVAMRVAAPEAVSLEGLFL
jgi:hypothetical protein